MFNKENASFRLQTGFWDVYRQEVMSYDEIASFIQYNFDLDDNDVATCIHCQDQFDVNKGVRYLVNHLQKNHSGYIIESDSN